MGLGTHLPATKSHGDICSHLNPHSSDFGDICALYSTFLHELTMQYRGGGGVAVGNFRRGIFRSGFILHAVLNLLWKISHPHAVSQPLVGGGLLMLCS